MRAKKWFDYALLPNQSHLLGKLADECVPYQQTLWMMALLRLPSFLT